MGLYMSGVSGPCGSVTKRLSFCPALFSDVADSPQPYMRSDGFRLNTGSIILPLSSPRFINENGCVFTCVESLSCRWRVRVSSRPSASRTMMRHGYCCISIAPLPDVMVYPLSVLVHLHALISTAGFCTSISSSGSSFGIIGLVKKRTLTVRSFTGSTLNSSCGLWSYAGPGKSRFCSGVTQ